MATIVEVAQRAGVSIATVSNVIRGTKRVSPAVHARVQTAIRELDYYPNEIARSLKVKQTRMLGIVLSDITNPFFPEVIRGAEESHGCFHLQRCDDAWFLEGAGRIRKEVPGGYLPGYFRRFGRGPFFPSSPHRGGSAEL